MRLTLHVLLVLALVAPAGAAPPPPAATAASEANARGMKRYDAKDYPGAAVEFRKAIALDERHVLARYNLACVAALTGDKATVVAQLSWLRASADPAARKALDKARSDPDLRSVKDDPDVRKLIDPGAAACTASCQQAMSKCSDECGGGRGCLRECDSAEVDCQVGCDAGMGPEGLARMRGWMERGLTGRDNDVARMRGASLSRDYDNVYTLTIDNQFGFACELEWAADGSPALLRDCKAKVAGYRATPVELKVRCKLDGKKKRDACAASYRLQADHLDDPATFEFERSWK